MAVDCGLLGKRGTQVFQFGLLLEADGADALSAASSGDPLLKGRGVQGAAAPEHLLKRTLLLRSGLEFVLERLAHSALGPHRQVCLHERLLARWSPSSAHEATRQGVGMTG